VTTATPLTDAQMQVIGDWFSHHHGYPVAAKTLDDLRRKLSAETTMTDPPRGLIKPAILGALTGLALALAAIGTLGSKSRPAVRGCECVAPWTREDAAANPGRWVIWVCPHRQVFGFGPSSVRTIP
jgi:hypothetical protein